MRITIVRHSAPLVVALALAGCGRKAQPAVPVPTAEPRPVETPATPSNDDAARRAREAEETRLREEMARLRAALEQMVFFDYDRSDIRGDARGALEAKVPLLRQRPEIRIRIEGHADERGSAEYNLALGLRRAESVRIYLTNFGIDAQRIEVATYGEERPLGSGADETSFARNRRAEFRIMAGLTMSSDRSDARSQRAAAARSR